MSFSALYATMRMSRRGLFVLMSFSGRDPLFVTVDNSLSRVESRLDPANEQDQQRHFRHIAVREANVEERRRQDDVDRVRAGGSERQQTLLATAQDHGDTSCEACEAIAQVREEQERRHTR